MLGKFSVSFWVATILYLCLIRHCVIGDEYKPYQSQRFVSSDGMYYVVVARDGDVQTAPYGDAIYTFAAVSENGSRIVPKIVPVESITDPVTGEVIYVYQNHNRLVQKEDRILSAIKVNFCPSSVLIPSDGKLFLVIDSYGPNGAFDEQGLWVNKSPVLMGVSREGKILYKKYVSDLLTKEEMETLAGPLDRIDWLKSYSLKSSTDTLKLVTKMKRIIYVDPVSGLIKNSSK